MKVMVFDVGGTGIKYSVMDEQLNRTDTGSTPTPADSQEHFLNTLREIYLPHKDEVDGIALSLPGFIDAEQGVVKGGGALSLAYNVGTPVGPRLAEACGCRVWIENDGKAAAIAELERGALKGCRNAAVFIIGTGVGGGIIVDGRIVSGLGGAGGEPGHSLLVLDGEPCTCGRRGCWEVYASATALIRQGREAAAAHSTSLLNRYPELTGRDVFDAADAGDEAAQAVLERYYVYVAAGITDLVNILSPEMVLIGGGISRQGERLLRPIRRYVAANCFGGESRPQPIIQAAQLGNEAGIIGAAAL